VALASAVALLLYGARRYFGNWGTTKDEYQMRLPGDELLHEPVLRTTEGVWIDRPTTDVWPWLVQLGRDRGGLYADGLLRNSLGPHWRNADRIHPEWQRLVVGDVVHLTPRGWMGIPDGIELTVRTVLEERAIVLHTSMPALRLEAVWSLHLLPRGDDRCRLLVRTVVALRRPGDVVLAELTRPAVALLTRGMLRGIRRRAQRRDDLFARRSATNGRLR
jgi:hypothetical protein